MMYYYYLYRCIALVIFICVLVFINSMFYMPLDITTTISSQSKERKHPLSNSSSSSSLSWIIRRRYYRHSIPLNDEHVVINVMDNVDNNTSKNATTVIATKRNRYDTIQYCYNPNTVNEAEYSLYSRLINATMTTEHENFEIIPQQQHQSSSVWQLPKIIWLLSFPNSGTTFTLKYIQGSTYTSTATNYGGNEQVGYNTSISLYNDTVTDNNNNNNNNKNETYMYGGPYLRYPNRFYPCQRILTKTHCHQDSGNLSSSVYDFINSCRIGNRNINQRIYENIAYHPSVPVYGAVHLIRNPYDNIVARMHYKIKQWISNSNNNNNNNTNITKTNIKDQELAEYITMSPEGLLRWCQYIQITESKLNYYTNVKLKYQETNFWETYMESLPCAIEFYKYFSWHHYTTQGIRTTFVPNGSSTITTTTTDDNNVIINDRSMVLYYEDYTTQFNATTDRLLEFLQLRKIISTSSSLTNDTNSAIIPSPPEFIVGKTYTHWFTNDMKIKVKRLAYAMLSNTTTWDLLQHYLE